MSLSEIVAGALAAVQAVAGADIVYRRGNQTVNLRATRGRTEIPMIETSGLASTFHAADYLILAEAIDFGDGPVDPKPDDEITDGDRIYRVLRVPGADCFRFSDHDHTVVRVHSKLWRVEA